LVEHGDEYGQRLEVWATAKLLISESDNRIASVGVSALVLLDPMFDDAAAPEP
jgi:hypothetical protein